MRITPEHLTSDQMLFLLKELDRELVLMSIGNTESVLVGGAAMAVRWADRGSVNIDSISTLSTDLKTAITSVARRHPVLSPDWLNDHAAVFRLRMDTEETMVSSFYKRCAEGQTPGFPRFKASRRWRTIEIPDATSSMVVPPESSSNDSAVWCRLAVKGLPRLRFRDKGHRLADAVEGGAKVRELRVVRTPLRTELHVVVRHPETEAPLVAPANPVGIDVGLTHRLTLSDGHAVAPRKIDPSRVKRAQRKLSRAKKGSRTRGKKAHALAKAHRREKERAVQADFRLAHHLVSAYDGIAVENLNVAGMLKSKRFSKKMSEQRWSSLGNILEYKAEKAGIPYERVDPRHTTTDCAQCGHRQPMPLRQRVFHCGSCGMCTDRDVNAAINIRARAFPGSGGTIPDAMRVTNLDCKTGTPSGECSAGRHRRTVLPTATSVYPSM